MNTKFTFLLAFFMSFSVFAEAQVVITVNDLPNENTKKVVAFQTNPVVEIGSASAIGQIWDFTSLSTDSVNLVDFDPVSGVEAFPDATFKRKASLTSILGLPIDRILPDEVSLTNETAYYSEKGGNVVLEGADIDIALLGGALDFGTRTFETDNDYRFYSAGFLGDSYETESNFVLEIPATDLPFGLDTLNLCVDFGGLGDICFTVENVTLKMDLQTNVKVDAYGTMKLPEGQEHDVLRFNEISDAHITLVPYINSNGVVLALPVDLITEELAEELAEDLGFDIRALLVDTTYTENIYRFKAKDQNYPVVTANYLSNDNISGITSVEFIVPPPDLEASIESSISETNCRQYAFAAVSPGVPSVYSWDFGDGNTSDEEAPVHSYETSDTYTVSLTISDEFGGESTVTTDLIVDCQPLQAGFTFEVDENSCRTVTFTNTTTAYNVTSTKWNFGDTNTIVSDEETITHTYNEDGVYEVQLIVVNFPFERDTLIQSVGACKTVGLTEIANEAVTVYPNPVANELNVTIEAGINSNSIWKIVDAAGKVVMQDNLEKAQNNWTVNVKNLAQGFYVLMVTNEQNKPLFNKKFVIEK